MTRALAPVMASMSAPTLVTSCVVVSTVAPRLPRASAISSRSPVNSPATVVKVRRPSSMRSAISTASTPRMRSPSSTGGAPALPDRIWMNTDPSSPSVSTAATESVRTRGRRSSRTRMRTRNRSPGFRGISMPSTSPASKPARRTPVPMAMPVTLPKSASTSNRSANSSRRSPIMNSPTANSRSPPITNVPTQARRGEPIRNLPSQPPAQTPPHSKVQRFRLGGHRPSPSTATVSDYPPDSDARNCRTMA